MRKNIVIINSASNCINKYKVSVSSTSFVFALERCQKMSGRSKRRTVSRSSEVSSKSNIVTILRKPGKQWANHSLQIQCEGKPSRYVAGHYRSTQPPDPPE